jgi:integrase
MKKWLNRMEVKRVRKHCMEQEQLDKALGRWKGIRNRALVEFLLGSGFRASECRDTKVDDLLLAVKNGTEPFIRVRTLKRKKKVVDTVTIDKELQQLLKTYLIELKRYKGAKSVKPDAYLFAGRNGDKISLLGLEKIVNGVFAKVDIPLGSIKKTKDGSTSKIKGHSVHSLRHTHGFHLYQSQKNLKLVQVRLRHASINSSAIYVGVEDEEERKTINGLYN